MRLLLPPILLVAACGGVSTRATSGAATGDQVITVMLARDGGNTTTDASAPEAATEAEAVTPSPGGCWCPSVRVDCSGSGAETFARADRDACMMHLAPAICVALGVEDGSTVDPAKVAVSTAQHNLSADEAYDFCGGRHEASHTCDGPDVTECASEVRAYGVTVACLTAEVDRLCEEDPDETGECKRIRLYVDAGKAARELNECVCAGNACDACTDACLAAHPAVPGTCAQAAAAYCP